MNRYLHAVFAVFVLASFSSFTAGTDVYSLKLAYMEKFTRFIKWSSENELDEKSKFVIGVIKPNPFRKKAETFAKSNRIKNKAVEFVELSSLKHPPIMNMVYIPDGHQFALEAILSKLSSQKPIIIGERKGYAKRGTHINFYMEGNKVRFEINNSKMENDGYKVAPQLLGIARVIK